MLKAGFINEAKKYLEKDISRYNKDGIIHQLFVFYGLKPVSTFGIKEKDREMQIKICDLLGLVNKIQKTNDYGYSEMIVSKNFDLIKKYLNIDKEFNKNEDINKEFGLIHGYTKSAINEFIKSYQEKRPIKFWTDALSRKIIPYELVIAWQATGMIPASYNDKESLRYAKKVIVLLDKIDPHLKKYYLDKGRKELESDAKAAVMVWKE